MSLFVLSHLPTLFPIGFYEIRGDLSTLPGYKEGNDLPPWTKNDCESLCSFLLRPFEGPAREVYRDVEQQVLYRAVQILKHAELPQAFFNKCVTQCSVEYFTEPL